MTSIFTHTELDFLKSIGFEKADSGFFEFEKGSIYTLVVKCDKVYLHETVIDYYDDNSLYEKTVRKTLWKDDKESLEEFLRKNIRISN